ncbi:c-type cytochrome biogenesis protein CcmI [uncultured Cohaesibacter sp.]|uniref:c-type cytochrome biogenesis protein CcmI n=1 Tax=uncultured Cohaesibacter sp. TaxID=1002546 RepID=UPI0029C64374|nr:c-type cytochrome biogenesis protein CcmI [uncultured Cohaesibacter sp.]
MFWTIAVVLTLATMAVAIYPLLRKERKIESANAYDLTIYKSQLKEIDGDVERGLIDRAEADAARAEVARRLIGAQDALDKEARGAHSNSDASSSIDEAGPSNLKLAVVAIVLLIPLLSSGLYFALGSPDLQSQPLQARLSKPPEQQSLTELVASAERKLANNPDDLLGWKRLAPVYARMRRTEDAIVAYRNILRLEGESVGALSDLGEVLVIQDAGVVKAEAQELFQRANLLDAKAPKPRFFLAIALGQEGQEQEAIKKWQELVDDSAEDAPWIPFAKNQIAALEKRLASPAEGNGGNASSAAASGGLANPSKEDVQNAAEMTAEERQQMIEGMVSNLAERLNSAGGTPDEWVRLIRAELVLNRPDMAAKTVTRALDALQSDVEGMEKVKAAARSLGVSITQ